MPYSRARSALRSPAATRSRIRPAESIHAWALKSVTRAEAWAQLALARLLADGTVDDAEDPGDDATGRPNRVTSTAAATVDQLAQFTQDWDWSRVRPVAQAVAWATAQTIYERTAYQALLALQDGPENVGWKTWPAVVNGTADLIYVGC